VKEGKMRVFDRNERSKKIKGFPGYEVTNFGRVFNLVDGREMTLSFTLQGDLTVGLMRDGRQHRRGVKVLVAKAFVDGRTEIFNTPIQLDGDKVNLRADNIVWRPRWFAWQYTHQFKEVHNWYFYGPVVDLESGEQYKNCIEASVENGVLCKDVHRSIYSEEHVFPTRQKFAYVN
jgi:hypothetical protein